MVGIYFISLGIIAKKTEGLKTDGNNDILVRPSQLSGYRLLFTSLSE